MTFGVWSSKGLRSLGLALISVNQHKRSYRRNSYSYAGERGAGIWSRMLLPILPLAIPFPLLVSTTVPASFPFYNKFYSSPPSLPSHVSFDTL